MRRSVWMGLALLALACADKNAYQESAESRQRLASAEGQRTVDDPAADAIHPVSASTAHTVAAPTAEPKFAGSLRIVLLFEGERLPSEGRALQEMANVLKQNDALSSLHLTSEPDQLRVAAKVVSGTQLSALPAAWRSDEWVVLLQILRPKGKKPKRVSGGLGAMLAFRPPSTMPVYAEIIEGEMAVSLDGGELGARVSEFLDLANEQAK